VNQGVEMGGGRGVRGDDRRNPPVIVRVAHSASVSMHSVVTGLSWHRNAFRTNKGFLCL